METVKKLDEKFNEKRIVVLTYDMPHQKTYDVFCLLKARGYKDILVYGIDKYYQKKYVPLIEHRPELTTDIQPRELCHNLGYFYEKTTYEQLNIANGSIILIAGAGILPDDFIEKYKIINSHPGYIPNCRGLDALKWAVYERQPIGVTTHMLGKEIDAGEIIERKVIPVYQSDTFHRLCQRVYQNEVKMLIDAIEKVGETHEYIDGGSYVIHRRMKHEYEEKLLERFEEIKNSKSGSGGIKHKLLVFSSDFNRGVA